jgi:hypothetical protein
MSGIYNNMLGLSGMFQQLLALIAYRYTNLELTFNNEYKKSLHSSRYHQFLV